MDERQLLFLLLLTTMKALCILLPGAVCAIFDKQSSSLGTYVCNLYTGFYFDYAFNNVRKNAADKELIIYNADNPSQYQYNSAIQSKYIDKEMIEKITPIAAGLKITLSFGAGEELKSPLLYEEKKPNKKRRFRRR